MAAVYDEIWCYPCHRIEEYLLATGCKKNGNVFYTDGCRIVMEPRPDHRAGSLALPRTWVRMEGPGAEQVHHDFLMHFLSGGG